MYKHKIVVGLDIDGTITEHPSFFSELTKNQKFHIIVITRRNKGELYSHLNELKEYGIELDDIKFAESNNDKARICIEEGVDIFFEDEDEYIEYVPEDILVLKVRNGGNYCFDANKFLTKTDFK